MEIRKKIKAHPLFWPIKLFLKRLVGRELWIRPDVNIETHMIGDWRFSKSGLDANSVVYSLGVGDSIEFDLEVIKECGAQVHAFDPTPDAVVWLDKQNRPPLLVFHQWAVSGEDGVLKMVRRVNSRGKQSRMMWSAATEHLAGQEVIEVPTYCLATIAEKLNHRHIDLVKMDVEGCEFDILESLPDIIDKPSQLLVEFHHRFPRIGKERARHCIGKLRSIGYKVFAVSATGREIGFIHESCLPQV